MQRSAERVPRFTMVSPISKCARAVPLIFYSQTFRPPLPPTPTTTLTGAMVRLTTSREQTGRAPITLTVWGSTR